MTTEDQSQKEIAELRKFTSSFLNDISQALDFLNQGIFSFKYIPDIQAAVIEIMESAKIDLQEHLEDLNEDSSFVGSGPCHHEIYVGKLAKAIIDSVYQTHPKKGSIND